MLNCKQFVEQCSARDEQLDLSPWKRFQVNLHRFICHHCRKYFKQFNITTATAKKLSTEAVSDEIIEKAVLEMKIYSEKA